MEVLSPGDIPSQLYRADARDPQIIYNNGFQPRGTREDLYMQIADGRQNFVSTTVSESRVRDEPYLIYGDSEDRWIYVIRPKETKEWIDVNKAVGSHQWDDELEIVSRGAIVKEDIAGAYRVGPDGKPTGEFLPNPNFNGSLDEIELPEDVSRPQLSSTQTPETPSPTSQRPHRPFRAEDGDHTTDFDLEVERTTPMDEAPWHGAFPDENGDVGLVGYIDPNTNQVVVRPGKPEEFRRQIANGQPVFGADGTPIENPTAVFTLKQYLPMKDYTRIDYVGDAPVDVQENLERTLSNQIGTDVVVVKEHSDPDWEWGEILERRTPYGEETIHPPEGVTDFRYEANAKTLARSRVAVEDLPPVVFRGTSNVPSSAFPNGFTPRGDNHNLYQHMHGTNYDSAYIPTSYSHKSAKYFPLHLEEGEERWVYAIQPPADVDGYDINKAFPSALPEERELAFAGSLAGEHIIGAWRVDDNGEFLEFVPNENFVPRPGTEPPSSDELNAIIQGGSEVQTQNLDSTTTTNRSNETEGAASDSSTVGCEGTCSPALECDTPACKTPDNSSTKTDEGAESTSTENETCVNGTCKSKSCFVAGTLVQTENGTVPIESLEVGDSVLARHEKTGELGYHSIVNTIVHLEEPLLQLRIATNQRETELQVTGEHPFFALDEPRNPVLGLLEQGTWTAAKNLRAGDRLVNSNGDEIEVRAVKPLPERQTVYNLTVSDAHTYFVGEEHVWVHNRCGPFRPEDGYQTTELDTQVQQSISREQAPWYEGIPRSQDDDIGLVGYIDPNTNQIHLQHGHPNEYRTQIENGDPILGPDGQVVENPPAVFTIRYGERAWRDENLTYVDYAGDPPAELQENLERTLANQLGVDVVHRKEAQGRLGKIPIERRIPYGEDTVHPPDGLKVTDVLYEDNAKVLERARLSPEELPTVVYRGVPTSPTIVSKNGFVPHGDNHDLWAHVSGFFDDSAFIATSKEFEVAKDFSYGPKVTYIYAIQPPTNIPSYEASRGIPDRRMSRIEKEQEISFEGSVSHEQVIGHWELTTGYPEKLSEFIPNENFVPDPNRPTPHIDANGNVTSLDQTSTPDPSSDHHLEDPSNASANNNTFSNVDCAEGVCKSTNNLETSSRAESAPQVCITRGADSSSDCFAAGTLVQTENGKVPIESVQEGDSVLALHEETGELGYFPVSDTMVNFNKPVRRIRVKGPDGLEENLVVTDEHPFFSNATPMQIEEGNNPLHAGQWKPAQDLEPGMWLLDPNGNPVEIIEIERLPEQVDVHNLTVDDAHTYFVGENEILTHNKISSKKKKGAPADTAHPVVLYRGSPMPPESAFEQGFLPAGTHNDLQKHTQGVHNPSLGYREDTPGNFVSTSAKKQVSQDMARSKREGKGSPFGEYVDGWLYYIYPDSVNDIDVNRTIPNHKWTGEYEVAVPGGIPGERIMGAQRVYADGSVGEFVWNPNRVGPLVPYTPPN